MVFNDIFPNRDAIIPSIEFNSQFFMEVVIKKSCSMSLMFMSYFIKINSWILIC